MASDARLVKEILRRNELLLRRHLVLSKTVLDKLCDQGLIADILRRKIMMYPAHKQVPLLVESLENRGLPSLRKFLDVLKETGHGYLVEHILDTEAIPISDNHRPGTTHYGSGDMGTTAPARVSRSGGSPRHGPGHMASLGSLLRMRHDKDSAPRGSMVPRTLLTDPVMIGPPTLGVSAGGGSGVYRGVPAGHGGFVGGAQGYPSRQPASRSDVPGTLYCLGQIFNGQQKDNEQALVVLRQEEMAIKQLMEQNARDQQKVRRKQYTMTDLSKKLADINSKATEMYEPAPHPHIGRYRLAQLNQIPWSVDQ